MEYITLISDASADIFPANKIGEFRVKLAKKITIDRERHQIGLKYISWPHKTLNVVDGEFYVDLYAIGGRAGWPKSFNGKIHPGWYDTPPKLAAALNAALNEIPSHHVGKYREIKDEGFRLDQSHLFFNYDDTDEKMTLRMRRQYILSEDTWLRVCVRLSKELYVKLGYGLSSDYDRNPSIDAAVDGVPGGNPTPPRYAVDLDLGQTSLFVYTDIIEADRIAGDQLVNLLSLVPAIGQHNTQQSYEPRIVEYCTPRFNEFDEVSISIRGDTGKPVVFSSGKVYITLHIKDKFE